jgi:Domain of unknown function (DUF4124)
MRGAATKSALHLRFMHAHTLHLPFRALAALALIAFAATAQAQWKWKDANGQVHISNLPPPREVAEKDILARPGAPATATKAPAAPVAAASAAAAAPGTAAPKVDSELEKRRKLAEAEEQNKKKAEEAKLASQKVENCGRARSQLATLESGIRIAQTNAKGEREFMDDRARQGEVQRAREVIASDCR